MPGGPGKPRARRKRARPSRHRPPRAWGLTSWIISVRSGSGSGRMLRSSSSNCTAMRVISISSSAWRPDRRLSPRGLGRAGPGAPGGGRWRLGQAEGSAPCGQRPGGIGLSPGRLSHKTATSASSPWGTQALDPAHRHEGGATLDRKVLGQSCCPGTRATGPTAGNGAVNPAGTAGRARPAPLQQGAQSPAVGKAPKGPEMGTCLRGRPLKGQEQCSCLREKAPGPSHSRASFPVKRCQRTGKGAQGSSHSALPRGSARLTVSPRGPLAGPDAHLSAWAAGPRRPASRPPCPGPENRQTQHTWWCLWKGPTTPGTTVTTGARQSGSPSPPPASQGKPPTGGSCSPARPHVGRGQQDGRGPPRGPPAQAPSAVSPSLPRLSVT